MNNNGQFNNGYQPGVNNAPQYPNSNYQGQYVQSNTGLNPNNQMYQPQIINETPVQGPQAPMPKKKNNTFMIIIVVIIVGLVGLYFFTNKADDNDGNGGKGAIQGNGNCIEITKLDMTSKLNGSFYLASGDTQYIFGPELNGDFLYTACSMGKITFKVCHTKVDSSLMQFQLGSTTKSRKVTSYEMYNQETGKKINATNESDLIAELGYHSYGEHTEEATLTILDDYKNWALDSSNGGRYTYYKLEIELLSGKKVEAIYKITNGQTDKINELEEGKKYKFTFSVSKDSFGKLVYTITDIEI